MTEAKVEQVLDQTLDAQHLVLADDDARRWSATRETIGIIAMAVAGGKISVDEAFGLMAQMADADRHPPAKVSGGTAALTSGVPRA
jgi:hypothetical protein